MVYPRFVAIKSGKITGDLVVDQALTLHGMVTGTVTVVKGGDLQLYGMVGDDLVVEEGGIAIVHGTVCRDVRNQGGTLKVYGTIQGQLYEAAGTTTVAPSAKIG